MDGADAGGAGTGLPFCRRGLLHIYGPVCHRIAVHGAAGSLLRQAVFGPKLPPALDAGVEEKRHRCPHGHGPPIQRKAHAAILLCERLYRAGAGGLQRSGVRVGLGLCRTQLPIRPPPDPRRAPELGLCRNLGDGPDLHRGREKGGIARRTAVALYETPFRSRSCGL